MCREATKALMTGPVTSLELLLSLCPDLEEDVLLALRFLYYVKAKPVVPDGRYDEAEKEFLERPETSDSSALMNPGSDNGDDYPDHVKALAFYLSLNGWKAGQVAPTAGKPNKTPRIKPQAADSGVKSLF